MLSNNQPSFYIGGYNGSSLVDGPLTELGWRRITDKNDLSFKLKWVEIKNQINYSAFKEGDQLVNHIPNCNLLTNKLGLLNSLQAHERITIAVKGREPKLKLSDFIPQTYRLDDKCERDTFFEDFKDGEIWICKPTGMNQGKGIYLVRDLVEFKKQLQERNERQQTRKPHRPCMARIIQRYIHNPMLLTGKKFDIRAYMLIASTSPYLVLYHKGYIRLSMQDYSIDTHNLLAHLTNQYIQKRDPNYKDIKDETVWSMDRFNHYVNEQVAPEKGLEQDWVYNTLTARMKFIMQYCFKAVRHKLQCKVGYFDLYGLDFMIDEDMKVWLIEINVNPSLATNCEALQEVMPGLVKETLNVSIECFEKSRKNIPLMPLQSLNTFQILHVGTKPRTKSATRGGGYNNRSRSLSPMRMPRNLSPMKDSVTGTPVTVHQQNPLVSSSQDVVEMHKHKVLGMTPTATQAKVQQNSSNFTGSSSQGGFVRDPSLHSISDTNSNPNKLRRSSDNSNSNRASVATPKTPNVTNTKGPPGLRGVLPASDKSQQSSTANSKPEPIPLKMTHSPKSVRKKPTPLEIEIETKDRPRNDRGN